jgi:4-hydroxybenzoate polyprenyltransferase
MQSLKNSYLYLLLRTARPRQWIKNTAIFASLVFSGMFFYNPADSLPYGVTVTIAFLIFCLLTSSVYIINDIIDKDADRNHPFKKKRPIASGSLPVWFAFSAAMTLLFVVFVASLFMPFFFRTMVAAYLLLQLLYVNWTKHIPILDVVSIATGFLIRIYAGALVINLHMSVWFLLTVISASLFLAVGKRQSERTLLEDTNVGETRKTLKRYSQRLLDQYTSMFANATWLTYALFTFQNEFIRPDERLGTLYSFLPKTLHNQKLLMLTVPFVIIGVMKYLQLIYEDNKGESPEVVLLRDKTLLLTVFMFGLSVFVIIYVLT